MAESDLSIGERRRMADELEVVRVRVLSGPNLWSRTPVVIGDVRPGALAGDADALAGARRRLAEFVPALDELASGADAEDPGRAWAETLARLALALQRDSGSDVAAWWRTGPGDEPESWAAAVAYEEEGVGRAALRAAARLLRRAVADDALDADRVVEELRERYEREHLGPTASVLVAEARRRGLPVRRAPGDPVVQLGLGCRLRRIDATLTDRTSVIATDVTSDKARTKEVLGRLGLPVPRGDVARSVEEAVEIAEDLGFPVLLKPLDANNGRGISPRIDGVAAVPEAYARARAEHPEVVVERFVEGRDHRVLVVNGRVVAVAERVPAHVVGDGARTIRELAEEVNRDPRRDERDHRAPLAPIPLDEVTAAFLARSGRTLESVPAAGETVYLRSTANISTGGTPVDRTDEIHPENAAICAFAADAVGLDVAGLDVVTTDIAAPFRESGATIIEVNASPGIRMHTEPERGTPRDVAGAILDALFPPGTPSRIPIVAVTGTNGKTTTTRLVAHLLRSAGRRVGMTTTDGVYFQEHLIFAGDMTGPMAADMVLSNPRVDAAVLETARGGILRAGLGYDACDVGVVLNVTADHLGLRGIHTVEQLAEVKAVIVQAVRPDGYAVLNADDPRVYIMRERTSAAVVLFSLGAGDAEPVAGHLRGGGMAVAVEGSGAAETIVLYHGTARVPLIAVADVPLTERGAARFQLQNTIAAAAAAWACGLDPAAIRAGLASFVASHASTPGRMNVVRVGGATVIVDYAHNPAAVAALLDYARRVDATRRIAVLSSPGDRRDEDIRTMGAFGAGLDAVVFMENPRYRRGRTPGENAKLLLEGLAAAGGDPARATVVEGEAAAVDAVRRAIRPGDLVLFVADDAAEVIAGLGAVPG